MTFRQRMDVVATLIHIGRKRRAAQRRLRQHPGDLLLTLVVDYMLTSEESLTMLLAGDIDGAHLKLVAATELEQRMKTEAAERAINTRLAQQCEMAPWN